MYLSVPYLSLFREPEVEVAGHIAPTVQLPHWDVKATFGVGKMTRTVESIVDGLEALV